MSPLTDPLDATDAFTDRVNAWLSQAMTRAKTSPVKDADGFTATLPPYRKMFGTGATEGLALADLRTQLATWAGQQMIAGHSLPTWESPIPEVTPQARSLVRVSNLRHQLLVRGAEFGAARQNLLAGAVERCLADMDAVVTSHAMQMNGVTPPPANSEPSLTA